MNSNVSILITLCTVGVALFALIGNMRNHRIDYLTKESQSKRENIKNQLKEFYVPMITYLQISKALSAELYVNKPQGFNILMYFLDKNHLFGEKGGEMNKVSLSERELVIIDEIILLSKEIASFIIKNGGLVEDERLTVNYKPNPEITDISFENIEIGLLGLLLSHYKILEYAKEGKIIGNLELYNKFKFPREIGKIINENYIKLTSELGKEINNYISIQQYILNFFK